MADKVSKSVAVSPLYQETSVTVIQGPPGPRGPQGNQGPSGPPGSPPPLTLLSTNPTDFILRLMGALGQSANHLEFRDHAGALLSFFDPTGNFTLASIGLNLSDALLLVADPIFSNTYVTTYTNSLVSAETWTATDTGFLRKKKDYTYTGSRVVTIRTRLYSITDGTTVIADMTETFSYDAFGFVTGSTLVRSI